jgi:hypothetical protein
VEGSPSVRQRRLAVREQSSFVEATWWYWSDVVLAGLSTLTCGQAAHSYWWIRPSRMSRRATVPPSITATGWAIGWASCRPR